MALNSHSNILFFFVLLFVYYRTANAQLTSNFYGTTCPKALSTIRNEVVKAVTNEHRMGASLLRLHFHDCFVNAMFLSFSLHTHTHNHLNELIKLMIVSNFVVLNN